MNEQQHQQQLDDGQICQKPRDYDYGSIEKKNEHIIIDKVLIEKKVDGKVGRETYYNFLLRNRSFSMYLASYITNHIGEWLTYLAALSAIADIQFEAASKQDQIDGENSTAQIAISILVVIRLMSNVIMAPFGGVMADNRDRRKNMILLDLLGALCGPAFVLSVELRSIPLIYISTFFQEVLSGMYIPSCSAILPLLVHNDDLERANILIGIVWSTVAAFATAAGGFLVAFLGTQGCFMVDSLTYLVSALLMWHVPGSYNVSVTESGDQKSADSSIQCSKNMIRDGFMYLQSSFFGALVFLKFSALWLTLDVVLVSIAERIDDKSLAPLRLGLLFSGNGLGCLCGPLIAERFTDMNRPSTIQLCCVVSLVIASIGCLGMGLPGNPFWITCILSSIRSSGISALWINSSLLLQKFSLPEMLGRVSSVDFALALIGESFAAVLAGYLQDEAHLTAEQVCQLLGLLGTIISVIWIIYHAKGCGASQFIKSNSHGSLSSLLSSV